MDEFNDEMINEEAEKDTEEQIAEPQEEKQSEPVKTLSPVPETVVKQPGNSKLPLILAVVLAILLSVGASALTTWLITDRNREKVVVYQGVDTEKTIVVTESDYTSLVDEVADTVVEVYTEQVSYSYFYGQYVTEGAGSGVIISSDGYIITNNHVIDGATSINVTLNNGDTYTAILVATDEQTDIAVIKIEATGLHAAVLGDSDSIKVGQKVIAIGNPLGSLGGTVTAGIISALSREVTVENIPMTLMQIGVSISPGNSGGGLFNTSGQLIGIVNAKSTSDYSEGIGFAIPINTAKAVAQDLLTYGYVTGRPALGISCISIDSYQKARYYGVSTYGVYVNETLSEEAKASGLQHGDVIVALNNREVTSLTALQTVLYGYKAGDTVDLSVVREGKVITVSIVLGQKTGE